MSSSYILKTEWNSLLRLTHGINTTCLTFVNFVCQELEVRKVETVPLLNYARQCKNQTKPTKQKHSKDRGSNTLKTNPVTSPKVSVRSWLCVPLFIQIYMPSLCGFQSVGLWGWWGWEERDEGETEKDEVKEEWAIDSREKPPAILSLACSQRHIEALHISS